MLDYYDDKVPGRGRGLESFGFSLETTHPEEDGDQEGGFKGHWKTGGVLIFVGE